MASESANAATGQGGSGPLSRRTVGILLGLAALVNLPVIALMFRPDAPTTVEIGSHGFTDDFNRSDLGDNYFSTGAYWRVVNGELLSPGAHNNPLFLKAALPAEVQVDFDARSESPDGDIKCEIFGNGYDHSSGYILVFGGWNNNVTAIARLDEHGTPVDSQVPDNQNLFTKLMSFTGLNFGMPNLGRVRVQRLDMHVEPHRMYHWTIKRKDGTLSWYLDGQLAEQMIDPEPLRGSGHDRFAFSTWDTDVYYDNLKITPL